MSKLFRKEALEHKHQGLKGDVLVLPRVSHTAIVVFLLAWVILMIFWLGTRTYTRKETVQGWLEPPQGVIKLYSQGEGIITEVLISEGEEVDANQPLIIVNGDTSLTDGQQLESLLLNEYTQQRKLLSNQIVRRKQLFNEKQRELRQQIYAAQEDFQLIEDQLRTMHERIILVEQQISDLEQLASKGHASSYEEIQTRQTQLSLTNELQSLLRSKVAQKNSIQQLENEYNRLPQEDENENDTLKAQLSQLSTEIARINARRAYVIKATKGGTINNLQAKEGNRPPSTTPLLSIVPKDSTLSVHLLVPVRAVGFITTGQQIEIRFDAFPYQKFGLYAGSVTGVSSAVLLPNELLSYPVRNSEPVYKVFAQLNSMTIRAYNNAIPLKAGMTLSADIELEERSLFQWVLAPLLSVKGRL